MKKIVLLLLLWGSMYAQKKVYNVQRYCIDEQPFKQGECNIVGNEYSSVFLDTQMRTVVFSLTATRLQYKIVDSVVFAPDKN